MSNWKEKRYERLQKEQKKEEFNEKAKDYLSSFIFLAGFGMMMSGGVLMFMGIPISCIGLWIARKMK